MSQLLSLDLCGLSFKNPVIGASGTVGYGKELAEYYDLSCLGGLSVKGMTREVRPGNDGIRIHETPSGVMNSIGLQNPSAQAFVDEQWPFLQDYDLQVIANVGGSTIEDYLFVLELLEGTQVPMIELNISCPNVKEGGMAFGIQCDSAEEIVRQARQVTTKPLMVKLSPNAENIREMAETCVAAGADALSLINTLSGMAIDVNRRSAVFDNVTAGLSGPAVRPVALRMVYEVCQTVDVPVVGLGGIETAEDAISFIMAGAQAIQVGTANLMNPLAMPEIIQGMETWMQEEGVKSLDEIRGII